MQRVFIQIVVFLLMINIAHGQVTFLEVANELNVDDLDDSRGVAIIDINNDNISEIIIINKYGYNRLYVWNNSHGLYYDEGYYYGISETNLHHNITVADVFKNHLPDLYITGDANSYHGRFYINSGAGPFVDMAEEFNLANPTDMGSAFFQMTPESGISILCGRRLMTLQNNTFVDITDGSGLENVDNVFSPIFFDIDSDNDDDLFIAHNWELNVGALFRNNGDSTFTDISTNTDEGGFGYGQGVTFGDIDNDGDFDLYLCSGFGTNTMWENDGTGYFINITGWSNTGVGGYSRGTAFGDFDNDCDLDLFINRAYGYNMLFLNNGEGVFQDYSEEAGVIDNLNGQSCSTGDLNNDGQLDVVAVNCDYEPTQVYLNQNQNSSFLKVKLIGCYKNTLALGAIIELYGITTDPDDTVFIGKREILSHSSYFSVNDIIAHFGTADYDNLRVVVTFKSLTAVDTSGITPGQMITIWEAGEVYVDELFLQIPSEYPYINTYPNPFNNSTRIILRGGVSENYELAIYDILGRLVKSVHIHNKCSSTVRYIWNGTNDLNQPVPSGVYLIQVSNALKIAETKITLVR